MAKVGCKVRHMQVTGGKWESEFVTTCCSEKVDSADSVGHRLSWYKLWATEDSLPVIGRSCNWGALLISGIIIPVESRSVASQVIIWKSTCTCHPSRCI